MTKEMYENCKYRFKGKSCEDCPLMCDGKEIIIDGVNVAKCQCFENDKCLWCKKYYENNVTPNCKEVKDCYFKQLQRLKQENEELKKRCEELDKMTGIFSARLANKYKQSLEKIREIIKTLIMEMPEYHDCYYKDECGENCTPKQQDKVTYCCFENVEKIENLINEVLNEK